MNDKTARLPYSAEVPDSGDDNPFAHIFGGGRQHKPAAKSTSKKTRTVNTMRTVNRVDLENASVYRWNYNEEQPETFPGNTAVGVSRKLLTALKTKSEADLRAPEEDAPSTTKEAGPATPATAAVNAAATAKRIEADLAAVQSFTASTSINDQGGIRAGAL